VIDFKSADHGLYFLLAEFASAPAGKYAIILVHKFLLIVILSVHGSMGMGPSSSTEFVPAEPAKDPAWN